MYAANLARILLKNYFLLNVETNFKVTVLEYYQHLDKIPCASPYKQYM